MSAYMSKYKQMSKREIRSEVDEMVKELNARLTEYRTKGKTNETWEKELDRLQSLSARGRGDTVSRGTSLKKEELGRYASELHFALAWDSFTPKGKRKHATATRKAYESFMKSHPDSTFTLAQYETFAKTMTRVKDTYLSHLSSDQVVDLYKIARENGRRGNTLLEIAEEVFNAKSDDMTTNEYIDEIKERLISG